MSKFTILFVHSPNMCWLPLYFMATTITLIFKCLQTARENIFAVRNLRDVKKEGKGAQDFFRTWPDLQYLKILFLKKPKYIFLQYGWLISLFIDKHFGTRTQESLWFLLIQQTPFSIQTVTKSIRNVVTTRNVLIKQTLAYDIKSEQKLQYRFNSFLLPILSKTHCLNYWTLLPPEKEIQNNINYD